MDRGAVSKSYTSWPTRAVTEYDVDRVRSALRSLEMGRLGPAALLVDAMTRDERIAAHLDDRLGGMMRLPREVTGGDGDGRRRGPIAKDVDGRLKAGQFGSKAAFKDWQAWGLMLGIGFAQLVYDTSGEKWTPGLEVWHPSHFTYDSLEGVWKVQTREGNVTVEPNNGRWAVYALADSAPYMKGLVRRLAIPYLVRQYATRDWARFSEVHGLPIRKGRVPQQASQEQKDAFFEALASLGTESTVEIPELSTEEGRFDIELVEAASRSWDGFKNLLEKCEASIAIAILGQNLTSEVRGGSRAAAEVHERVKLGIIQDDAELFSDSVRRSVFTPYAVFNYGDAALAPFLSIDTEPPADLKADAETMKVVAEALNGFQKAGYDLDVKELEAKFKFKLTPRPEGPTPDTSASGDNGTAQGTPEGNADQGGAMPKPTPAAKGAKSVKASAKPDAPAKPPFDPASGFVEGQMYADALTEYGGLAAAPAMTADLATLGGIIDRAESYDDLREGLKSAFADANPDQLNAILQKTLLLANLAGRVAITQDL